MRYLRWLLWWGMAVALVGVLGALFANGMVYGVTGVWLVEVAHPDWVLGLVCGFVFVAVQLLIVGMEHRYLPGGGYD